MAEVLGDTGDLTPFADPSALAAAALRLLVDGDLHARRSAAARQRAVEHFATEKVLAAYLDLYERVLQ